MLEHSQLNERLWECNLQENGVNLGHMTTKSANNNQSINDISDLFMIACWIHYSKMLLKLIFTACVVQVKKLKKEENLSRFLQINKTDPRYIRIAGKGTTSIALTWFTCMLQTS
ncbi:uncharacterized protein LOC110875971 [Helianthus annuus]|uniref:uncharacterized protein LOC110875971 n=1 Tax=Helianthus annuus TaxID=4232 RepID=UPI000B8FF68C|nr:uncharacterized protein LOC110875971 [Helianthus annuus]